MDVLEAMKEQLKERLEPKFHPLVDSLANVAIRLGIEEVKKSQSNENSLKLFSKIITENQGCGQLDVRFFFDDNERTIETIE